MNNTVLRIISAALALGAIAVAYFAIQLSKAPPPPPPVVTSAPSLPKEAVAVATRAIKAGEVLTASAVAVKGQIQPPASAYRQVQDAAGRVAAVDIPADTPLTPAQFLADSIAYLLKPGERAVGIQIDEVSSVGGFTKPGEFVDVLAYLPPDGTIQGSAQLIVENARLLTIGDSTALDNPQDGKGGVVDSLSKDSGAKAMTDLKERRLHLKSAVLAVRDVDVNRLVLAANAGLLRLALRPPVMPSDPNAKLIAAKEAIPVKAQAVAMSELGVRKTLSGGTGRKLVVQEGSKEKEAESLWRKVQP